MIQEEREAHIRHLADSHCRNKHRDYYDSLICVGPNPSGFGPPCDGCIEETRKRLEDKRATVHGRPLSPEETAEMRRELGLDD